MGRHVRSASDSSLSIDKQESMDAYATDRLPSPHADGGRIRARLRSERFDAIWTAGGQVGAVDLRRAFR
jgi:hypothetical protein